MVQGLDHGAISPWTAGEEGGFLPNTRAKVLVMLFLFTGTTFSANIAVLALSSALGLLKLQPMAVDWSCPGGTLC